MAEDQVGQCRVFRVTTDGWDCMVGGWLRAAAGVKEQVVGWQSGNWMGGENARGAMPILTNPAGSRVCP